MSSTPGLSELIGAPLRPPKLLHRIALDFESPSNDRSVPKTTVSFVMMDWILMVEIVTHHPELKSSVQEMHQRTALNVRRAVSQVLERIPNIVNTSRVNVREEYDPYYRPTEGAGGFRFGVEQDPDRPVIGMRINVDITAQDQDAPRGLFGEIRFTEGLKLAEYLRTPDVLNVLAGILRTVDVPWNARMEKAVSAAYAFFADVPEFVPSESNPKLQRMRPENQNRRDLNEEVRWGWAGGQGYRELAERTEVGR